MELLRRLWRDEEGQAMSEYGLVMAILAVGAIIGLVAMKDKLVALLNRIGAKLDQQAQ